MAKYHPEISDSVFSVRFITPRRNRRSSLPTKRIEFLLVSSDRVRELPTRLVSSRREWETKSVIDSRIIISFLLRSIDLPPREEKKKREREKKVNREPFTRGRFLQQSRVSCLRITLSFQRGTITSGRQAARKFTRSILYERGSSLVRFRIFRHQTVRGLIVPVKRNETKLNCTREIT